MIARTAPRPRLPEMTEAELLSAVKKLAMLTGWVPYHTRHSVGSDPGFPDLVLVNVRQRRIVYAELKSPRGRLRPQQDVWLGILRATGAEVALWRPEHWHDGTIRRVLQGQRIPADTSPDHATGDPR